MKISERIVALRKARKLSRYKLGQLSGVSKTHLDNIEHGKNSPFVEILSQLLDVLDCSLSEFSMKTVMIPIYHPKSLNIFARTAL